jgi:acetolactate decarboxylase
LADRATKSGVSVEMIVNLALSEYLNTPLHTLFQVSTSGALVAGVYDKQVSVQTILEHGDFGGTFAHLDGEMVVLDGHAYQVLGTGAVAKASPDAWAPFAVVTRFSPETKVTLGPVSSLQELQRLCDPHRKSGNLFYALRPDGTFARMRTKAVNPAAPGARLLDAAKAQSEFSFENISGTLVGLWSPVFSSAFSVAGYHLHFLSSDHQHGGHVLDLEAERLQLQLETLNDFHLVLPESQASCEQTLPRTRPTNSLTQNRRIEGPKRNRQRDGIGRRRLGGVSTGKMPGSRSIQSSLLPGPMKIASFNINNINRRLSNLLHWLHEAQGRARHTLQHQ